MNQMSRMTKRLCMPNLANKFFFDLISSSLEPDSCYLLK